MAPKKRGFQKSECGPACFQPGFDPKRYRNVASEEATNTARNFNRLPKELYNMVDDRSDIAPTILRPSKESSSLLESACTTSTAAAAAATTSTTTEPEVHGNRLVSMSALCSAMSVIMHEHQAQDPPCCTADFQMPADGETRLGLGSQVTIICVTCKFAKKVVLYEEIKEPSKPGHNMPKPNMQLAVFLMKSAVSYQDIRMLFSSLDIPPISEKSLAQKVNKLSEVCEELNQEEMARNCEKVMQIVSHRSKKEGITVITDTSVQ